MSTSTDEEVSHLAKDDQWLAERLFFALKLIGDSIEINPQVRSGVPVLRGTRFPAAQVLAELAAGRTVAEIASEWELDEATVKSFLEGLSIRLDRPFRP